MKIGVVDFKGVVFELLCCYQMAIHFTFQLLLLLLLNHPVLPSAFGSLSYCISFLKIILKSIEQYIIAAATMVFPACYVNLFCTFSCNCNVL